MYRRNRYPLLLCLLVSLGTLPWSGCSIPATAAKRASVVGVAAAAGGLAAHELSDGDPGSTAGGAAAAAALANLALRDDESVRRAGYEDGYVQGQSDTIKRHYFLRHEQERLPLQQQEPGGRLVHYELPVSDAEEPAGGKKSVTVRVVE